eukprot:TRINITY_DN3555_c0_g1_i1.p1 TRINITY_DN3555_c0_g1~~TRINITY_DN3555_c0_g1_i1.p1  ORF type:complete len:1037 (-),score=223.20 TRINITY_DN3555_c0_g1_i1:36-3146(-)
MALMRGNGAGGTPSYCFKVVVIGEMAVGKSSLMKRALGMEFSEQWLPTIGIDTGTKLVTRKTAAGTEFTVKLQIWDTSGQEKFRCLSSTYYRGAAAVIVCYDISSYQTFLKVKSWLSDAEQWCSKSLTVVLAGTKADLPQRQVAFAEARKFADKCGMIYLETSAKTGTNIDTLIDALLDGDKRLPAVSPPGQVYVPLAKEQLAGRIDRRLASGKSIAGSESSPLVAFSFEAQVHHVVASITATYTFVNATETVPLQVTFFFPHGESAGITALRIKVGDQELHPVLVPKVGDMQRYEHKLQKGSVLFSEEDQRGLFACSTGLLMPNELLEISVEYVAELQSNRSNEITLVLPMVTAQSSVLASIPPAQQQQQRKTVRVRGHVHFSMPCAIADVDWLGPTAGLAVTTPVKQAPDDNDCGAECDARELTLDSELPKPVDLEIVVRLASSGNGGVCHTACEGGALASAIHILAPPAFFPFPKNIVIFMDKTLGSTAARWQELQRAIGLFLHSLSDDCSFDVVAYGTTCDRAVGSVTPCGAGGDATLLDYAQRCVATWLPDTRGKRLLEPLLSVVEEMLPDKVVHIILVTDVIKEAPAVINVCRQYRDNCHIFPVAVGERADLTTLKELSKSTGGVVECVQDSSGSGAVAGAVVRQLRRALNHRFTSLAVDWGPLRSLPNMLVAARDYNVCESTSVYGLATGVVAASRRQHLPVTLSGGIAHTMLRVPWHAAHGCWHAHAITRLAALHIANAADSTTARELAMTHGVLAAPLCFAVPNEHAHLSFQQVTVLSRNRSGVGAAARPRHHFTPAGLLAKLPADVGTEPPLQLASVITYPLTAPALQAHSQFGKCCDGGGGAAAFPLPQPQPTELAAATQVELALPPPAPKPSALDEARHLLDALLALQAADGAFDAPQQLASLVGVAPSVPPALAVVLTKRTSSTATDASAAKVDTAAMHGVAAEARAGAEAAAEGAVQATALAVALLETRLAPLRQEWCLAAEKSRRWLTAKLASHGVAAAQQQPSHRRLSALQCIFWAKYFV